MANSGLKEHVDRETCEDERQPIRELTEQELGREGERLAAEYLKRRGMRILQQNWRCRFGEVDIIAEGEDDIPILIEVKTRRALDEDDEEMPELAVDYRKQEKYRSLGLYYLACHPKLRTLRFDVIAITIVGERCARLRHLMGACEWDD